MLGRTVVTLSVLLCATACGSRHAASLAPVTGDSNAGGDADGGDSGCLPCEVQAAQDACHEYVAAFCGYIYRCYSGSDLQAIENANSWTGEVSCNTDLASQQCVDAIVKDPIEAGREVLVPSKVDACLASINNLTCGMPFADFLLYPTVQYRCEQVPDGAVPPGGTCVSSNDCAGDDGYCSSTGVCGHRSGEDYEIPCSADNQCPGQVCIPLATNQQNEPGICSRACSTDADCGIGASCVPMNSNQRCVSTCLSNADCSNGFICEILPGDVVGICAVTQ